MRIAASFISGGLFGLGLVISGMSNPAKVIGFLDITGNWDPSLALVMAGGLIVTAIGYRLVFRRAAPVCDSQFHVPTNRVIDARLVGGAAIFGIGWGLGGFCPGPGVVATALGYSEAIAFVAAMLVGMWLKDRLFGTA
ncbi:YeeE/YedE family protein [Pseudokordiimonas caeni]|uniref:YeeE/YedE family protein n=1 Tax=Pseudokordiimonas caeni TaxID=2997908 RepID=UPI0028115D1A|nr:YeeE/YedE family protein [Pseudokordiimonas caeni]